MQQEIRQPRYSHLRIPRHLVALLSALQMHGANLSLLEKLSDEEWRSLLTFCDLAQLTLTLAQLPLTGAPAWVTDRLTKNIADNGLRFERVKATYEEVKAVLEREQIDHVVIKGFTQTPDFVPDPRFRMQSDVDLYCPPETIEPARKALKRVGYESSKGIDYSRADHEPTLTRIGDWRWRGNMFDPEMPLSIELHYALWNERVLLFPAPGIEQFWERLETRSVDGMSFRCLNKVDQVGYLALHILRNLLPGGWVLHHVRELSFFLHTHEGNDSFWAEWIQTHDPLLRAYEAIAFYYARTWFACELHPLVEGEIARLPHEQRQWLDRFVGSSLEGMFEPNKDWVWLHWSLIRSPRAKMVLLRHAFVPHISSLNSIGVQFENRQPRKTESAHPYLRYMTYLTLRCRSFSYATVKALFRGVRWRVACSQSD